ncbi:hypothetical protein GYMLUDRAFT_687157 [Collybiopsis luxurians FD-317 M1]|uniref:Uncharacterized protein n=1 Tax=Collybiopsis luxurians FD-317 M1 TaxID=944289 RepID=A0A0D0BU07_9AGAR|nr:hypothetical protein GYMLUDRAFT_687157 [Collybiopsis luxurians FD-317 M1]
MLPGYRTQTSLRRGACAGIASRRDRAFDTYVEHLNVVRPPLLPRPENHRLYLLPIHSTHSLRSTNRLRMHRQIVAQSSLLAIYRQDVAGIQLMKNSSNLDSRADVVSRSVIYFLPASQNTLQRSACTPYSFECKMNTFRLELDLKQDPILAYGAFPSSGSLWMGTSKVDSKPPDPRTTETRCEHRSERSRFFPTYLL